MGYVVCRSCYTSQLSSACRPADITIDCGVDEQIHVIWAYYGTRSGGSRCVWTPEDCLQSVEAAEYSRITDSCQGQSTCTVGVDKVSPEPPCGSEAPREKTDYEVIEYRCVPMNDHFPPGNGNVTHSCDRDLNTPVCSGDTVIDVSAAYYMDIVGLTTDCTRRSLGHDCRSPVQPSYLEEIKDKCNQNQACEDLDQRTSSNTPCILGDWNVGTEYVAIVYRCVTATDPGSGGDEEVTTESRDGNESDDDDENTSESKSGINKGAVIGIAVVAACVVITIIAVTFVMGRKRKNDSQNEKQMKSSALNNHIDGDDYSTIGEQCPVPSAPRETLVHADPGYRLAQSVPETHNNESTTVLTVDSPEYETVDGTVAVGDISTGHSTVKVSYSRVKETARSEDIVLTENTEYTPWEEDDNVLNRDVMMTYKQNGSIDKVDKNETVFVDNKNYAGWDETKSSTAKADTVIVDNQHYAEWDETKDPKPKGDTLLVDNQNYAEWDEKKTPKP